MLDRSHGHPSHTRDGKRMKEILQAEKEDDDGNLRPILSASAKSHNRRASTKKKPPILVSVDDTDKEDEDFVPCLGAVELDESDDEEDIKDERQEKLCLSLL
jgi:hypothetical protein